MPLTYDIADWMSMVDDSKLLSELSIPGTHDSASMMRPGFSDTRLTTQTRTLREQLEDGVRFLDLRCGYVNGRFGLYHEDVSLQLSFTEARDTCRQFLADHPRETIITSIKNEYQGSGNNPRITFQGRFLQYVGETPSLWYLENAIPTLGQVRGKLVLFRRFPLDIVAQPRPLGINAFDGFPDKETKTIDGPPKLTIQDQYSLVSGTSTPTLLVEKWKAIEALLSQARALDQAQALKEPSTLFVNFTSAAGRFSRDSFPRPVAEVINPQLAGYLNRQNYPFRARLGIIPRDYEGLFANGINELIARSNTDQLDLFFLKSKLNGDVVDLAGSSDQGTPVIAYRQKTPAAFNQLWLFSLSATPPDFFIFSRSARLIIGIAQPTPGAALQADGPEVPTAERQLWRLAPSDEKEQYFFITNKLTGEVITIGPSRPEGGNQLVTSSRKTSGNDDQLWSFIKSESPGRRDG
ncbi:MAG: 1-phosphatidylinositol phosphodiesterase [Thermoanaerobaculia bacterium]|jgi:1-phosphatidylinositol phosphodiesterase|nr:1-phosphatidylinositol phosphodiesterase [Thermoanaerobaculia bacterium]